MSTEEKITMRLALMSDQTLVQCTIALSRLACEQPFASAEQNLLLDMDKLVMAELRSRT